MYTVELYGSGLGPGHEAEVVDHSSLNRASFYRVLSVRRS